MNDMYKDPMFWISIISTVIALYAVCLNYKQIKLSNKQHLFDRRLAIFLLVRQLIVTYEKCREELANFESLQHLPSIGFKMLTYCDYLEEIYETIDDVLNTELWMKFLDKCNFLEKTAVEIDVLWKDEKIKLISIFVMEYKNLLRALYNQNIFITQKDNHKIYLDPKRWHIMSAKSKISRDKLYEIITEIDETYKTLKFFEVENRIKKSIKL